MRIRSVLAFALLLCGSASAWAGEAGRADCAGFAQGVSSCEQTFVLTTDCLEHGVGTGGPPVGFSGTLRAELTSDAGWARWSVVRTPFSYSDRFDGGGVWSAGQMATLQVEVAGVGPWETYSASINC